ncbi:MAG: hypothetical protein QOH93_215 [Chloroflexia bacterium]|jgi:hypothetical protein|nr:hypothetical protein [Chloroflexia bacterium]
MQGIKLTFGAAGRSRLVGIVVTLLVMFGVFGAAFTPASAQTSRADRLAQYKAWMIEAKAMYPYPQTIDKMYRVMMCESSGNPSASGGRGTYLGLYQYHRGTWGGSWNPYRKNNIFDARSQIFATAKAWSIGMQSHWSCYYITPGR